MHDIQQIARLNQQAFDDGPQKAREAGKHVVTKNTGLHLVSFDTFETHHEAAQFIENCDDTPDVTRTLHDPISAV